MFSPSKKGEGLITISEKCHISNLFEKLNTDELLLNELPQITERRELGFVLKKGYRFFNDYRNNHDDLYEDDDNERYEIVPIIGKSNKNNSSDLTTHIKEYDEGMDDKFLIDKSENTKKLLRLIEEMDETKGDDFQLMKKAFELLQNEKFVYGLERGAYQIRKKDLVEIVLSPEPVDAVFEVSQNKEVLSLNL